MSKEFNSGLELRQKILKGATILADNVASTLGPKGRNVILHPKNGNPIITKDGVTVAKFVELEDPFENVGAQTLKQAALQTNVNAGDGTTTSTVLAAAILKESQKYLAAGSSPIELKRGISKATDIILEKLSQLARPIKSKEDIEHVAKISANGDEKIGKLIASAVDLIGKDGAITIEEARSVDTTLDVVEGFRFQSGYLSPTFITDERTGAVKYNEPLLLVTDAAIETVDELMPALEIAAREGRPFVVVAENVEGQALAALIMNAMRGTLKVAAVKAPQYGEERRNILKDLCISTGATFVSREAGLSLAEITLNDFGTAKSIEILNNLTTIVAGNGEQEDIEKRIETLKALVPQTDSLYESEKIQERITRLASGIAIIRVGAPTEVEMIEKKHRIEDSLAAVKAAQEEGIVTGGGSALIKIHNDLKVDTDNQDQMFGVEVVKEAIKKPLRQMAINAGESPDLIVNEVINSDNDEGWNFIKNELTDMYVDGIIDPVKVTRNALQNASSAAATLITTDYCIIEK